LSGKRAFKRETAADTMAAIMMQEPPELTTSGRDISPALDHIVKHCLEKDRDHRFQTARDIAFNLSEQYFAPAAASVSRQTAAPAAPKRNNAVLIAAGGLLVLGIAAAVLLSRRPAASPAAAGPSIAVLPFRNLSEDRSQDYFSDGLSEELAGLLAKVKNLRVAGHMSSFAFKGKTDERLRMLRRQLKRRVGVLPPDMEARIKGLSSSDLEDLGEALLEFRTVEELAAWLYKK